MHFFKDPLPPVKKGNRHDDFDLFTVRTTPPHGTRCSEATSCLRQHRHGIAVGKRKGPGGAGLINPVEEKRPAVKGEGS